jgi:hypothetical protein
MAEGKIPISGYVGAGGRVTDKPMAESLPQARTGVVQHPSAPAGAPGEPQVDDPWQEILHEAELGGALAHETRKLVRMLDDEIGRRWMSLELRLQIEECEVLLGDRGFGA